MIVANYYPQYSRLDLFNDDNILTASITGVEAHVKAVNLAAQGTTTMFIKYESEANNKRNKTNKKHKLCQRNKN